MRKNNTKQTYIAILRGINVGGHRKIVMKDLKLRFEEWGFEDVLTYIQSGNVVFSAAQSDCDQIAQSISDEIQKYFSSDVPVVVKTIAEWQNIIEKNPFLDKKEIDHLHITFLQSHPQASLPDGNWGNDEAILVGSAIYLHCPNGYGKTKLTNNYFENKLKTIATTRNLKTVYKLQEMALSISLKD